MFGLCTDVIVTVFKSSGRTPLSEILYVTYDVVLICFPLAILDVFCPDYRVYKISSN